MADDPGPAVRAFCLACGPADPERFFAQMARLAELLAAANARTNLTRIRPGADFWTRHVADSLACGLVLPDLRAGRWRLLDLGCGAGFPALVLAAAYPALAVTALDSNRRKIEFVAAAVAALGLANCTAVAARAREFAASGAARDGFDLVVARAVGAADGLCREAHRLLRPGGRLVLYKTPDAAAAEGEALRSRTPAKTYAWTRSEPYSLPDAAGGRVLLVGRRPEGLPDTAAPLASFPDGGNLSAGPNEADAGGP